MMTTTYSAAGGLLLLIVLQRELILAAARPDVENHVRRCGECLEFSKSKDYSACKVWFRILLLICPLLLRCIICYYSLNQASRRVDVPVHVLIDWSANTAKKGLNNQLWYVIFFFDRETSSIRCQMFHNRDRPELELLHA